MARRYNKKKKLVDFNPSEMVALFKYIEPEREVVPFGLKRDPALVRMAKRVYEICDDCRIYLPHPQLRELSIVSLN